MLISKTPFRISFFGGGTDYDTWIKNHGGRVISSTIDKYLYLSLKPRPSFHESKYRIVYSKIDNANSISQINHSVVRKAIQYYKIKSGLELHYDADLPSRSGIGSSSSFTVGLLNVLDKLLKKRNNKLELSKKSIFFEQKVLKETVGLQDQIAASFGGFNLIEFKKNKNFRIKRFKNDNFLKKLNSNLLMFHSGIYRTANDVASQYTKKLNKSDEMMNIMEMTYKAEEMIENENLDSFGSLLDQSWKEKRKLSKIISNDKIDKIYNTAIEHGALGGKLLGAGSGGFLIFYVPKKKQYGLKKVFKDLINIPFKFSNHGSQVFKI